MTAGHLRPGTVMLVSGFDPAGQDRGGLFAGDGREFARIDGASTTGLRMHRGSLIRCLWNAGRSHAGLVIAGADGSLRRARIEGVGNPHDVIGDGSLTAVVATEQNQVVWFRPDGTRARTWQPGGEPDSWHLNSLVRHAGRLLVCAFGRFTRRKQWDLLDKPASGCVVDLESGATVFGGLRAPHTPRFVDGRWIVCNSADGELLAVDGRGAHTVLAALGGWPRGMAVTGSAVFVGVSPPRHELSAHDATSRVVVLSRSSFEPLGEIRLPVREIYDLEIVPARIAAALRRGSPADPGHRAACHRASVPAAAAAPIP
jgi:uncharacterized protein DUF4915